MGAARKEDTEIDTKPLPGVFVDSSIVLASSFVMTEQQVMGFLCFHVLPRHVSPNPRVRLCTVDIE